MYMYMHEQLKQAMEDVCGEISPHTPLEAMRVNDMRVNDMHVNDMRVNDIHITTFSGAVCCIQGHQCPGSCPLPCDPPQGHPPALFGHRRRLWPLRSPLVGSRQGGPDAGPEGRLPTGHQQRPRRGSVCLPPPPACAGGKADGMAARLRSGACHRRSGPVTDKDFTLLCS